MPAQDTDEKKYYSISEVSEFLNVNPSLIRYWEGVFPGIQPRKNKKGTRFFTKKDLENLHYIYYLVKEKGHTLKGAKKIFRQQSSSVRDQFEVREGLKKLRKFLLDIKEEVNKDHS